MGSGDGRVDGRENLWKLRSFGRSLMVRIELDASESRVQKTNTSEKARGLRSRFTRRKHYNVYKLLS
jgi:hypothetical protein